MSTYTDGHVQARTHTHTHTHTPACTRFTGGQCAVRLRLSRLWWLSCQVRHAADSQTACPPDRWTLWRHPHGDGRGASAHGLTTHTRHRWRSRTHSHMLPPISLAQPPQTRLPSPLFRDICLSPHHSNGHRRPVINHDRQSSGYTRRGGGAAGLRREGSGYALYTSPNSPSV